jgi:hypothetical protein
MLGYEVELADAIAPAPDSAVLRKDVLVEEEEEIEETGALELSRRLDATLAPPPSGPRPRAIAIDADESTRARSACEAARVAAASLAERVGARAVIIQSHDPFTTELRAIGVKGARASSLLGAVESSQDDFVASTVFGNGGALTMLLGGGLPRIAPRRLAFLGAKRSVVAVPIVSSGRFVGLIEVIDAENSLASGVEEACREVSESLAPLF